MADEHAPGGNGALSSKDGQAYQADAYQSDEDPVRALPIPERFDHAAEALRSAREYWDRGLTPSCVDACRRAAQILTQIYLDVRGEVPVSAYEQFGRLHGVEMKTSLAQTGHFEDMNPAMDQVYRLYVSLEGFLEDHGLL